MYWLLPLPFRHFFFHSSRLLFLSATLFIVFSCFFWSSCFCFVSYSFAVVKISPDLFFSLQSSEKNVLLCQLSFGDPHRVGCLSAVFWHEICERWCCNLETKNPRKESVALLDLTIFWFQMIRGASAQNGNRKYLETKRAGGTIFRAFCHVPFSEGLTGLEANHERRKDPPTF